MTDAEHTVLMAAFTWWRSRRPVKWDEATHAKFATINCAGPREKSLARAVARWFKEYKRAEAQRDVSERRRAT